MQMGMAFVKVSMRVHSISTMTSMEMGFAPMLTLAH
jgi:hypothetical protein